MVYGMRYWLYFVYLSFRFGFMPDTAYGLWLTCSFESKNQMEEIDGLIFEKYGK